MKHFKLKNTSINILFIEYLFIWIHYNCKLSNWGELFFMFLRIILLMLFYWTNNVIFFLKKMVDK